eukprot:gb/GEZN01013178.1/.p1 GENE.gb/GEZN01013178.1/~~gb/GEZN01013178.1/.p1  ORF type:complete len:175 (-),score=30.50 gb/GEZN01013178.1/:106-630(-)
MVKAREKERKRAEDVDVDGDAVMRGEQEGKGADNDALPTEVPSIMAMGAYVYDKPTVGTTLEDSDFAQSEETPRQLAQLDTTVPRYTRFLSKQAASAIIKRILEVAKANGGRTAESDESFSAAIEMRGVHFVAEVFKGETEGSLVVDFRRKKGDSTEFRKLFTDIRAQLPDLLV